MAEYLFNKFDFFNFYFKTIEIFFSPSLSVMLKASLGCSYFYDILLANLTKYVLPIVED